MLQFHNRQFQILNNVLYLFQFSLVFCLHVAAFGLVCTLEFLYYQIFLIEILPSLPLQ